VTIHPESTHPARIRTEIARPGPVPWMRLDHLVSRLPWLEAGITWRGEGEPADMGLFGAVPVGQVLRRWRTLSDDLGFDAILHSRQVHGADILVHDTVPPGFHLSPDADGHTTDRSALLLTVSVADCVPVWIVDTTSHRVALLHAGWRGVAAGILENGLHLLRRRGSAMADLHVHFGPAICGRCYEVGPEVHVALGLDTPSGNQTVDLRAVLVERARTTGLPAQQVTASSLCTRCDSHALFSHRGGSTGRQIAFIGTRASAHNY